MKRTPTRAHAARSPRVLLAFALASRGVRFSLVVAPLSATFSTAAAAQPQDNKALARQHFQRGVELANQNAYGESLLEFSRAYQLSPHHSVLYNIGQAHVALGHAAQAVDALKRYLSEGGANIDLERRKQVEAEIIRQFERTAPLEVRVDAEQAWVTIDGEPRGRTPLAGPVRVDVGTHRVAVALDSGERSEQIVTVTADKNQFVEFRLKASPPLPLASPTQPTQPAQPTPFAARAVSPPTEGSSSPGPRHSTLGIALGVVGVGLGGASLAHFFWNQARHRDWEAKYEHYFADPTPENREDANQLAESIPRANAVTISLALGAGLALGSGTFLLLTDSGGRKAVGSVVGWRGAW